MFRFNLSSTKTPSKSGIPGVPNVSILVQKNNVTYIDIICENTVDDNIVGSLRNKIDLASQSLGEKLREWLIESKKKKK